MPTFHPLTPDRWADLAALFGPRGACAGCWCMWWRRDRRAWEAGRGASNRRAFARLVRTAEAPPGVLAYAEGRAIAWCAIAPREDYGVLERSRTLARVDDRPVWAVTCFFVARGWRGRGVTVPLLRAAVRLARRHGARLVEGYPVEPRTPAGLPAAFAWTGLPATFRRAGFREVARRSPQRPIVRRRLR